MWCVTWPSAHSARFSDDSGGRPRWLARAPQWFLPAPGAALDAETATQALGELPIEQREVVVAHIWGGLSFDQIAAVADISSSTAHRRYQAGLTALRERLGVSWNTENTKAENTKNVSTTN